MANNESAPGEQSWHLKRYLVGTLAASLIIGATVFLTAAGNSRQGQAVQVPAVKAAAPARYPLHRHIRTTEFWVGEPADPDNRYITNTASTWVDDWADEFGGVDNPDHRCGYRPCGFKPKENAFYFALPFNDYRSDGTLKAKAELKRIPWYHGPPATDQSLVKNRWIAVTHKGKTVYGQWEDAGPFGEDDAAYVFGSNRPKANAGLDLSPAMNDYLDLHGEGLTDWRFVKAKDVPKGPWKQVITASGLRY